MLKQEFNKKYYKNNLQYFKNWYVLNKDKIREYQKINQDKIKLRKKLYNNSHKNERSEYDKNRYEIYKDKIKKEHKKRYENKKHKILSKAKIYHRKHKEKHNIRSREYDKNHPEKRLKSYLKRMKILSDINKLSLNDYIFALISWSKTIKKRDKVCQVCGSFDKLNAHHILYKSTYPQLSLNPNNGITLCKQHHYETHGILNEVS